MYIYFIYSVCVYIMSVCGHTLKLQLIDQLNLYDQRSVFFKIFAMLKKA